MEKILNDYLDKIEKYLKPMVVSERIDIVKEIKSEMIELQNEGRSVEEIIARLGDPKELAKAYLGDLISQDSKLSWKRVLTLCAFYCLAGFSGMIVIPTFVIVAPVFMFCGIVTPILGMVKMMDYIFTLNIPYVKNIGIVFAGIVEFNPVVEFVISLFIGVLIFWAGRGAWKLLIHYIKIISKTKQRLPI